MGSTAVNVEPFDIAAMANEAWAGACDWMTANAGTAASVISAIAAILAIWVAVRIQRENTSPSVIAYIEKDGIASFKLVLRNIGQGAAYDVKIENFDMGMVQGGTSPLVRFAEESFATNSVPMLAPGSARETILTTTVYARDNLKDRSNSVTVSWSLKPAGSKRKSNECVLEYGSFLDSLYSDPLDLRVARALEGIQNELKK